MNRAKQRSDRHASVIRVGVVCDLQSPAFPTMLSYLTLCDTQSIHASSFPAFDTRFCYTAFTTRLSLHGFSTRLSLHVFRYTAFATRLSLPGFSTRLSQHGFPYPAFLHRFSRSLMSHRLSPLFLVKSPISLAPNLCLAVFLDLTRLQQTTLHLLHMQ